MVPPAVDNGRVVWSDARNATVTDGGSIQNFDIYMLTITTGEVRQISTDPANQFNPQIRGNLIVYQDDRGGSLNLYYYDLATGLERPLSIDTGDLRVFGILPVGVAWAVSPDEGQTLQIYWNPAVRPTY